MALVAAIVEGQTPLFIHDQSQGELTEIVPFLLVFAPLGEAGAAIKGMNEGIVIGGVIDQELLPQREALVNPVQELPLNWGKGSASNRSI